MTATVRLVAWLALAASATAAAPDVDYHNPVRSAAEDEVTQLPRLSFKPSFRHYSGYLEADDRKPSSSFLHYWFVESKSSTPDSDPLVLWLNGGPGCSSMLGLLTELGPFRLDAKGESVVENALAWNARANIIFLESPAFVGYSYALNDTKAADDDSTAEQNHLALRSFLRKFPKYRNNALYLTGESYAGVYLPTLAVLVDKDPELKLKGVAVGNGYLDANKLAESLVYFSYYHGLVGRSTWQGISKHCCSGREPARGDCSIVDGERGDECARFVGLATDAIVNSGVNPYNLYDECAASPFGAGPSRRTVDKRLMAAALSLGASNSTRQLAALPLSQDLPCTDESNMVNYLNELETRRALHIPDKLSAKFASCTDALHYRMIYPQRPGGLAPQMRQLISSPRKLTLLVYNGDIDLMCNFFGDEWFVDDLGRKVVRDYSAWYVQDQVAGYAKYFDKITYFTVKGSGHMVPTDRPAAALLMFEQFLDGMKPPPS